VVEELSTQVRGLWRSETIHQENTDEVQFHIDTRIEENMGGACLLMKRGGMLNGASAI